MVRIRRLVALVAALVALWAVPAHAQLLQRLTVGSFVLSSDVDRPQAGTPFHLVVTLHVREPVGTIRNLELPMLAQLDLLGDERHLEARTNGTTYTETITVSAQHAGTLSVGPAILQVVDPRDGRAKQYATNGLTLTVSAAPGQAFADGARAAGAVWRSALTAMVWIFAIGCTIAVVLLVFARRPATRVAAPVPVAAAPIVAPSAPLRSDRDRMLDALTVLRVEPTRATAVRARAAVWSVMGAGEGDTLGDVLTRPGANDPPMRAVLIALERAAFTYDADLAPAIAAATDALQEYLNA